MNEEEIKLFSECEEVLKYVNSLTDKFFHILQVSADTKDIKVMNGNKVLFRDNLNNCRNIIAGMLLMAKELSLP